MLLRQNQQDAAKRTACRSQGNPARTSQCVVPQYNEAKKFGIPMVKHFTESTPKRQRWTIVRIANEAMLPKTPPNAPLRGAMILIPEKKGYV